MVATEAIAQTSRAFDAAQGRLKGSVPYFAPNRNARVRREGLGPARALVAAVLHCRVAEVPLLARSPDAQCMSNSGRAPIKLRHDRRAATKIRP